MRLRVAVLTMQQFVREDDLSEHETIRFGLGHGGIAARRQQSQAASGK
jgi:hypothetical protein